MGWLAIADLEQGRIIAEANFKSSFKLFAEERLSFVWHPSSRAIIVQDDVELQDIAAITRAGFVIGQLPADLRMHQAGFSADASFIIAERYDISDRARYDFYYLECSLQGLQVCLGRPQDSALPEDHRDIFSLCWMPGSNTLILECDGMASPMQVLLRECNSGFKGVCPPRMTSSICDRICSSGRLYMKGCYLDDEQCNVIAGLQGGQELLHPSTSDLGWSAMHVGARNFSVQALARPLMLSCMDAHGGGFRLQHARHRQGQTKRGLLATSTSLLQLCLRR